MYDLNDIILQIFENLSPAMLLFVLTDPAIEVIASQQMENECKYLFEDFYAEFTRARLELLEKMKDDE